MPLRLPSHSSRRQLWNSNTTLYQCQQHFCKRWKTSNVTKGNTLEIRSAVELDAQFTENNNNIEPRIDSIPFPTKLIKAVKTAARSRKVRSSSDTLRFKQMLEGPVTSASAFKENAMAKDIARQLNYLNPLFDERSILTQSKVTHAAKKKYPALLQTLHSLMGTDLKVANESVLVNKGIGHDEPPLSGEQIHCAHLKVEELLQYSLKNHVLSAQVQQDRSTTLARVQAMLHSVYSSRYRVKVFGSTLYGVSTPSSDLDMVILDPNRPKGQKSRKVAPIYAMRNLAKSFRSAGFTQVVAIPKAKVPIVKFYDPVTGLYGDINANDRLGLFNSLMIKHYCDIQPILRPMLGFIKCWAKPLGLNKPGIQDGPPTFSSYAFALMTIAFLQSIRLLPNLQDVDIEDPEQFFIHRYKPCHIQFRHIADGDWRPPGKLSLREALYGWFKFWGTEYQYFPSEGHRIDIKAGFYYVPSPSPSPRVDLPQWKGPRIRLVDPFAGNIITIHISTVSIKLFRTQCQLLMNFILPDRSYTIPSGTVRPSVSIFPIAFPQPPPSPSTVEADAKIARLRSSAVVHAPQSQSPFRIKIPKGKQYSGSRKENKYSRIWRKEGYIPRVAGENTV